jgi:hypothetical protein
VCDSPATQLISSMPVANQTQEWQPGIVIGLGRDCTAFERLKADMIRPVRERSNQFAELSAGGVRQFEGPIGRSATRVSAKRLDFNGEFAPPVGNCGVFAAFIVVC